MDQNTLDGLIMYLDSLIVQRDRKYDIIDREFHGTIGHMNANRSVEYWGRRYQVDRWFQKEVSDCRIKMDVLRTKVCARQPALTELESEYINANGRFPRRIALGQYHIHYEDVDFDVPAMFEFPFRKAMYICNADQLEFFHKIVLRLMYALPITKQEYYIFDPNGMGNSMWMFNQLFANESLFPYKVMTDAEELKTALKSVMDYIQNLHQYSFNLKTDCGDWDSYNRRMASQKNTAKMLPYKVFIFLDVPDGMDKECFEMFRKLLLHGEKCGLLVLFSFNEVLLRAEDRRMNERELQLKKCVEESMPLHEMNDRKLKDFTVERISIQNVGEQFPERDQLVGLLDAVDLAAKAGEKRGITFGEMLSPGRLFAENSAAGLSVPCGSLDGGIELSLTIGDSCPHYLVGGMTGSGKSNFLHNLIMSACWNYSPDELTVYLLDFKEGVEFARYAEPGLPHATLVAVEADAEYAKTVLIHLEQEKTERYRRFKESGCRDILSFRKANPAERMPRILVVIDEFQLLFEDRERSKSMDSLSMLAKQGRACGIHLVLATQSLKGLSQNGVDFNSLAPQFGGRIALKSSAEDSRMLLGSGLGYTNDAASEIEVPFAILNTSQGNVSKNIRFAVPEAVSSEISEKILEIRQECARRGIRPDATKIFKGQAFPEFPPGEVFRCERGMQLVPGCTMGWDEKLLRITLKPGREQNVLICGEDDRMKKDLLEALVLSAAGCACCDEISFVGESELFRQTAKMPGIPGAFYRDLPDFAAKNKDALDGKRRILLLDDVEFPKELGFSSYPGMKLTGDAAAFRKFWDGANQSGTYAVAFYGSANRIRACAVPKDDFRYRIGYCLSQTDMAQLTGDSYGTPGAKMPTKNRAFLAETGSITAWFRPFERKSR